MTLYEIAAILGALAWCYPIGVLIHKLMVKPKVSYIPADRAEIGYTSFGPIFNLDCAIATKRKDAILEKFRIDITHEKGEKHSFKWNLLNETQTEILPFSGSGGGLLQKSQQAIAIKISTSLLLERKILFRDVEFLKQYARKLQKYEELKMRLKKTDSSNQEQEIIRSKEYVDLIGLFERSLYWREGKYDMIISSIDHATGKAFKESYSFKLDTNDEDRLKENIEKIKKYFNSTVSNSSNEQDNEETDLVWNWIYPEITKDGQ